MDNKEHREKKPSKLAIGMCIVMIVYLSVLLIMFGVQLFTADFTTSEEIGIQAVMLMYDFGSYEDVARNQSALKEITTEEVYNQLTFDKEERTLYTYLKFKDDPCRVNVIDSTDDYVLYSLSNDNILSSRKFIFLFDVDEGGQIRYAREEECIDFVDYIKTGY